MTVIRVNESLFAGRSDKYVAQLDAKKVGWKQARSRKGGYLDASFVVVGDIENLQEMFYTWLGHHIEERGGGVVWEGYVHEMVLHHAGVSRTRSLDGVYNAIKAKHKGLLYNGGFEMLGGATVFENWNEETGPGASVDVSGSILSGEEGGQNAVQLTRGGSGVVRVYQDVPVTPLFRYRVSVSCSGTNQGGTLTVSGFVSSENSVTNTATNEVKRLTLEGIVPDGVTTLTVSLYGTSLSNIYYFDNVEMVKLGDSDEVVESFTEWATNDQSIARYGRRELIVDAGDVPPGEAELFRNLRLQKVAWPHTKTPSFSGSDEKTSLEIKCLGYWATAFFKYLRRHQGNKTTYRSTALTTILDDTYLDRECEWLTIGKIEENLGITNISEPALRAGEAIARIVNEGSSNNLWRFWVGNGRLCRYEPVDSAITYYRRHGQFYDSLGARQSVNTYQLQPGVWVRDTDYPALRMAYDSLHIDGRDFFVDEWEVDTEGGISPVTYDDGDE